MTMIEDQWMTMNNEMTNDQDQWMTIDRNDWEMTMILLLLLLLMISIIIINESNMKTSVNEWWPNDNDNY